MATALALDDDLPRRARNKARTRAAILDAALACIVEAGAAAATMDQIAAAAGVARATLFNYFPSKSDILDALVEASDAGFYVAMASWRAAPGLSVGERLLGLFAATAHFLRVAPARKRALVGLSWSRPSDPVEADRTRRVADAFAAMLADAQARSEVSAALDVPLAAQIVCHAYVGLIHQWRVEPAFPATERMTGAARLLAAMIAPGMALPDRPPLPPGPSAEKIGL